MRSTWAAFTALTITIATFGAGATAAPPTSTDVKRPARVAAPAVDSNQLLLVNEGNRMRRVDVDSIGTASIVQDLFIASAGDNAVDGRDVNGQICSTPDGHLVMGEDSGQPHPPPGWGVFDATGRQVGKLASNYYVEGAEPHGCVVDRDGRLFTGEVGNQASGDANGQLLMWFPPYDRFPGPPGSYPDTDAISTNFCKLAIDISTATGIATDAAGNVYVASSRNFEVQRFRPPFPTAPNAAGGCGRRDALGAPLADSVRRDVIIHADPDHGMLTFTGLAIAPNGNLYLGSVITGRIAEYTTAGGFVRMIVEPPEPVIPTSYGTPQSITVGPDGTVYYADLDLVSGPRGIGPGPNGKAWRVRFDTHGDPMTPEIVLQHLAFPDGVRVVPGNLSSSTSLTMGGTFERQYFRHDQSLINADTVRRLRPRWRFPTGAIITGSPAVAAVRVPGEGIIQAVFFSSWDGNVYALRFSDGSELWRFTADEQPGASYPAAASVTVADIDGRPHVFVGMGENEYALDAATGAERWHFTAGTGCRDAAGNPPGLCAFNNERNGVESTALVVQPTANDPGLVIFGMDVNDIALGKGGLFAVDLDDGRLRWYFDPQSGRVCTPNVADEIRRYDGYHREFELGLPAGFLASRPGCDHPRDRYGCSNIWSSPAYDPLRRMLFVASSNCETDDDPNTPEPAPPMPPYDEALFAVHVDDGSAAWRWRPREVDNADLAFGAAPNLFTVHRGSGIDIPVVGIGNKDGTYYVLGRDGVNHENDTRWDDSNAASDLPYWKRNLVPGGAIGGIIQTAAVDEIGRRIHVSTGPGFDPLNPQKPTVHTLQMDTGNIEWQNIDAEGLAGDAGYSATSGADGIIVNGATTAGVLRVFDAANGEVLFLDLITDNPISGIATGAAIVDGNILVGGGIGQRGRVGSTADTASRIPNSLVAMCVSGARDCSQLAPIAPGPVEADAAPRGATVRWAAPRDDGGAPIVGYRVTVAPGGRTVSVGPEARRAEVGNLSPGTRYTFTVAAENHVGFSPESAQSNAVTPGAITCSGFDATIVGTDRDDRILGTAGRDVIVGLGGDDLIGSLAGNDVVCGGPGNDIVFGGVGRNRLRGDSGNDALVGGAGNDRLRGDRGRDAMLCGAGDDAGSGGAGRDLAFECEVVLSAQSGS